MSVSVSVEDIDQLPLFAQMTSPAREELLRHAVVHSAPAGTVLFEQGTMPTFQHVLLEGAAHLFGRSSEGKEVLIEVVEPPDLIIPAAVVTNSPYLMQARVQEASRFLLIQADAFRRTLQQDPALSHALVASLAGQFRRMVRQIKNLKLRSASQRAGCYILALRRKQGGGNRITLPYEKTLIASELGLTRESFSRALASLQHDGIEVQANTILIHDDERLAAACGPDPLIDPDEELHL
ncbi:CRP/FNR family transcriptional activator FtrB [Parvibaculum indicum]|uniref:cyclic nucleotide-binding domain-containing protein n=1 Tax=Parvibaculum TaxID=256616 RepID=UPI001FEA5810|nr:MULTISPECIES: cyclic nucleotide-binding domain-containing protein [Parvibaculum]NIJ43386.1 CRP/FNR family transcriptional activator FtrB [Parvibaculum indicum]